jgi:hypothetical protein
MLSLKKFPLRPGRRGLGPAAATGQFRPRGPATGVGDPAPIDSIELSGNLPPRGGNFPDSSQVDAPFILGLHFAAPPRSFYWVAGRPDYSGPARTEGSRSV